MKTNLQKWIPIALCCLPGIAIAAIVAVGTALGGAVVSTWLSAPLGLGLLALAILACPVSMMLMMRRRDSSQQSAMSNSAMSMDCCLPASDEKASSDQLSSLRARREALERELAELQIK